MSIIKEDQTPTCSGSSVHSQVINLWKRRWIAFSFMTFATLIAIIILGGLLLSMWSDGVYSTVVSNDSDLYKVLGIFAFLIYCIVFLGKLWASLIAKTFEFEERILVLKSLAIISASNLESAKLAKKQFVTVASSPVDPPNIQVGKFNPVLSKSQK